MEYREDNAARDNAHFMRMNDKSAQFSMNSERPRLRYDEEITIRIEEILVVHTPVEGIHINGQSGFSFG